MIHSNFVWQFTARIVRSVGPEFKSRVQGLNGRSMVRPLGAQNQMFGSMVHVQWQQILLLLINDTQDSDTRTTTYDTRTITHDTLMITNLLNSPDRRTITIKHTNERFYTIKHAKSKLVFKIRIKETYCFNLYHNNMLVFYRKGACTVAMRCFIFYK